MQDYVYLDHAAMSPVHPQVAAAMLPWLRDRFGNPSAQNRYGREADAAIEEAREAFATALNCRPAEIVFTSGGSESLNAAIKGIAYAQNFARLGSQLVVSTIEHHAVLHTCEYLEKFGFETAQVAVDEHGVVDPAAVAAAVTADTALVSIMLANNEVGVVQRLAAVVDAVRERGRSLGREIPLHTDAVQAPNWLPLDVQSLGVDSLSLSAHKFGGPTGAGVLYVRRGIPFLAQQSGGGQERQRRAGTEHVPGIVGAGVAIQIATQQRVAAVARVEALRNLLVDGVRSRFPDAILNSDAASRLPNIINFSFPGVEGERFVTALDELGVAVSSGSACMSTSWEPSHVLLAMGLPVELATAAIRFSFGPETTLNNVDTMLDLLPVAAERACSVPAH